jgi:two-component system sensor histidine kinase HydH
MNHLSVSMGIPKRQTPNHNERLPPSDRRGRNGTHAMKMPTQETKCNETHVQLFRTNQHTEKRGKPSMAVSTAAFRVGLAHLIHEIYNPIQLVYFAACLMDTHMPKANGCGDPRVDRVFQELKLGVDQLVSLVTSLRSELESLWQINPHFNSLNLNSFIDETLRSQAAPFAAGGIRVRQDIAANLPPIQADEKLLKQAFLHLFRNAADAMPNGGDLRVAAGGDVRSVCIELADTGVGIPPDVDVFQPFVTSKPGGMGLGLVITRHIVETHGGTITYRSQPGRGTTFCVTLPRTLET